MASQYEEMSLILMKRKEVFLTSKETDSPEAK